MNPPADRRYTNTHEWALPQADGTLLVGVTESGQDLLGDVVFAGDAKLAVKVAAGDAMALLESVKAAVDVHAPVAGEVLAFNTALEDNPALVNEKPWDTWIVRLRPADPAVQAAPLDAAAYGALPKD
jgi:glycine cleavage system H protein